MEEIIAKKYATALIDCYKDGDLDAISTLFTQASQAFSIAHFIEMIDSPYVPKSHKRKCLLSLFDNKQEVVAFIDVLIEYNRIKLIPLISTIIDKHLRAAGSSYDAMLYAPRSLDSSEIDSIATSLSHKLGVVLNIRQSSKSIDGIRLIVWDLGVEVSFLKDRFFHDLTSYILRSINT